MRLYFIIVSIIFIALQIIPGLGVYQDHVYKNDRAAYELAKTEYDSITSINRNNAMDSLISIWISSNDTALRKVKKITKTPEYDEYGYYQKTGRWECEEGTRGKLICEPEKRWITTDYYISGYKNDTVWTAGYKSREEWIEKARIFAKNEGQKIYPEFHAYNGHELHYLIKCGSWLVVLYFVGAALAGLLLFIPYANIIEYDGWISKFIWFILFTISFSIWAGSINVFS